MNVLRYAAFTVDGAGGNPAGVVLDATGATESDMLAVAADLGYSESAFLFPAAPGEARPLRYFSPRAEVPFCGHATIATAVAVAEREGPGRLTFATGAGTLGVDTARDSSGDIVATITSVATRSARAGQDLVAEALSALRWSADDLDPRFPPHVAYAGVNHLVLAARTRARLAELDYDFAALDTLMAREQWTTVHLVHAESPALFHARDPFPPGGIVEDPATGAAAAAFGGYLRDLGMIGVGEPFTIRQGEDLGRPCQLTVTALSSGEVCVSGHAVAIAD